MNSGGFTEIIWHFAGYLHISEDIYTVDTLYDGGVPRQRPDDTPATFYDPVRSPYLDELTSKSVPFLETVIVEPASHLSKLSIPGYAAPKIVPNVFAHPLAPLHLNNEIDAMRGGFAFSRPAVITVSYQDGGTQMLFSAHQINEMDDRDTLVSDALRLANGEVVVPPEVHAADILAGMLRLARDATPSTLLVDAAGNTESLTAAVSAQDAYWAAHDSLPGKVDDGPPTVGRIVDGKASSEVIAEADITKIAPWRPEVQAPTHELTGTVTTAGPTHGVGTVAETGLNTQSNVAGILDNNESSGSLMIGGNYYFSRGIVQVNVLTDNDHIDIARADSALPNVFTHGNEVHNIAEFVTHEITSERHGAAGTPRWNVDTVQGNFYDVKTIVQFNGLDDNDRTVQVTSGTYFEAKTGLNQQGNLAKVTNLDSYDVIIVRGDYHRADWIFQYNIMLDSDVVKMLSSDNADGSGADVTAGFNRLTNSANITTYDSTAFKTLNESQHTLLDGLDSRVTVLTPHADWQLSGNSSGTLKVLYVSGDYYDVNVITQVNQLVDVDQSIQASATENSRQGVASGGNSASNYAQIVDPGTLSTSKYLGGRAYEDAILIQTNLITDNDTVKIHDTSTLVSELVAFAHDADSAGHTDHPFYRPGDTAHHDILI